MSGFGFGASVGWLVVSAVASLTWLAWALRLEGSRGRQWRRLVLVAAAGCLFLLATRPLRRVVAEEGSAILLTAGAPLEQIDALASTAETFALRGAPESAAEPTPDVALLARQHPEVDHWVVAGVGLQTWDLDALPGRVTFAAPAEPVAGIDRARWSRQITLGQTVTVAGSARPRQPEGAVLQWIGPAGVEDELALEPRTKERVRFSFESTPRQEGRLLYRIAVAAEGAVEEELIDVVVGPRRPPAVLWLEGAPGFETRHVKSWLRDLGGAMVVRSRVSRGRYRYEYLNHDRVDLSRLTSERIAAFDLVVLDQPAWESLSPTERGALTDSVKEGLGVLLRSIASETVSGALWAEFELAAIDDLDDIEISPSGPGVAQLAPLVVPARELIAQDRLRPILSDDAGRMLAAFEPLEQGSLAVTLIEATYRWVQRGDQVSHRLYWSCLLESVARRATEGGLWNLPAGPILVDNPLPVSLIVREPGAATVLAPNGTEAALPLAQDVLEPRRWHATYRPRSEGWHRLEANGGEPTWFYAQPPVAWESWRQRQATEATERRALLGAGASTTVVPETRVARPFSRAWFFATLVLSLGLLWADEQWRSRQ